MAYRHHAFLSYNHGADAALAAAFQRGLEHIAKPLLKLRAMNVFRDATDLTASPALWPGIVAHLESAEWLLLFACPAWAASMWCNKEVQWWLDHRSPDRMLIVLTGGDIAWDRATGDFDWSRSTALPALLARRLADEPLFVDLRWALPGQDLTLRQLRFRDAVVNVAAPLRGVRKDELDSADQRQLARNRWLVRGGVTVIVVAGAIAVWQAVVASQQRDEAVRQRDLALARQFAAQADLLRVQQPERLPLALLMATQAARMQPDALETQLTLQSVLAQFPRPVTTLPQGAHVSAAEFSPDRQRVALAAGGGAGALWSLDGPRRLAVLDGADRQVVFTRGGERIAGCCKRVAAWDRDGAPLWSLGPNDLDDLPGIVDLSADGQWLAVGFESRPGFALVKMASGQIAHRTRFPLSGPTTALTFLRDGRLAVVNRKTVNLYALPPESVASWPPLRLIEQSESTAQRLAASPDGRWLAMSAGNRVTVLDLERDDAVAARLEVRGDGPGRLIQLRFDGGGRLLGAVGDLNSGAVWQVEKWRERVAVRHGEMQTVHSIAFDTAGNEAVSCATDGYCIGWSLATGQRAHQIAHLHAHAGADPRQRQMLAAAFAPSAPLLVSGGTDGTAKVWDLTPAGELSRRRCEVDDVLVRTFTPAGRSWASGFGQLQRLPPRCGVARPADARRHAVVPSVSGRLAAAAAASDVARVWETASGRVVGELVDAESVDWEAATARRRQEVSLRQANEDVDRMRKHGSLRVLALSDSGERIATLREADRRLTLRATRDGRVLFAENVVNPPLIEFLSDALVLRVEPKGTLTALELPTGRALWSAEDAASAPLVALAVRGDGRQVAAAHGNARGATLRVFDAGTGRVVFEAPVDAAVNGLHFDPSGTHLIALTGEATPVPTGLPAGVGLRLWHIGTRKPVLSLPPDERIVAFDVAADAKRLATVGSRGELQVWDLDGAATPRRSVVSDPGPVAFGATGRWLAVGNRAVRILDAATLQPAGQIDAVLDTRAIEFRDDDRVLVLNGFEPGDSRGVTQARHWRSADLVAQACARLPLGAAQDQWRQLFPLQPVPLPCSGGDPPASAPR